MRLRCAAGHEVDTGEGSWTALVVAGPEINDAGALIERKYNFCMHCWGSWAQAAWPLAQTQGTSL